MDTLASNRALSASVSQAQGCNFVSFQALAVEWYVGDQSKIQGRRVYESGKNINIYCMPLCELVEKTTSGCERHTHKRTHTQSLQRLAIFSRVVRREKKRPRTALQAPSKYAGQLETLDLLTSIMMMWRA